MDFDTSRSGALDRPAPPAPAPTEIELGASDEFEPTAPPKESDAVDDLFMELIED